MVGRSPREEAAICWDAVTASLILLLTAPGSKGADAVYPRRPIQIMAPAAPGGGWDQTARAIQTALAQSLQTPVQVYNAPGAGGAVGLAEFAHDRAGDPHQLMVGGLVMLGAARLHGSAAPLERVTPIASLTTEWEALVVAADSPFATIHQLLDAFRSSPTAVCWGGGSAGGTDHMLVALVGRRLGVDASRINYVAYSGGGEATIALLSRAATVGVAGVSEFRDQAAAGRVRFLAVSSDFPIPGVDAPTLREAGVDVVLANWRGVFAPPGITDAERTAVTAAITAMQGADAWRAELDRRGWIDFFKAGPAFARFLDEERTRVEAIALRDGYRPAGPWFFPAVVGAGFLLVIAAQAVAVFQARRGRVIEAPRDAGSLSSRWAVVALLALLVAYALALGLLGYVLATVLFFPTAARLLGSRRPVRDAAVGVALAGTVFFAFTRLLEVRLP